MEALETAGCRRFRPIMLTSMTTVAGLFPMLLQTSLQAQVLIPMAASLIFGLTSGTFLILYLVPIFYSFYGFFLEMFGIEMVEGNDTQIGKQAESISPIPQSTLAQVDAKPAT